MNRPVFKSHCIIYNLRLEKKVFFSSILKSEKLFNRRFSQKTQSNRHNFGETVDILGEHYQTDHLTNITPAIISKVGRNLHNVPFHPLNLIFKRIEAYFHQTFLRRGNPVFSAYNRLSPVVTLEQNFDSLLVPPNHVSRSQSDTYYINSKYMLRAHTSAHQRDLIRSGLDSFIVAGDVYRRDAVDSTHYPVFHQVEGVRLFSDFEVNIFACSFVYFHC